MNVFLKPKLIFPLVTVILLASAVIIPFSGKLTPSSAQALKRPAGHIPPQDSFLNNPGNGLKPPYTINRNAGSSVHKLQPATSADDWASYLFDSSRSSYNAAETLLNPQTALNLNQKWVIQTGNHISVQPVVVNGVIYWGSWDGYMHATDLNGNQLWATFLGVNNAPGCNPSTIGVASSATVRSINVNGVQTPIVFVGGGDGKLYALYASNGQVLWSTSLGQPPAVFMWSSPAAFGGSIYQGVASFGDCPLVQGKVVQLNWRTGAIQHVAKLVPDGCVGAGVWGSPTLDRGHMKLYVSTGTQDNSCTVNGQPYVEPYALAIVEMNLSDLSIVDAWRIPASQQGIDSDFGVSPTLFYGMVNGVSTPMVGAGNKNGIYYAFARDHLSNGPVWEDQLASGGTCPDCGDGTISSSAWDGKTLYEGAGKTTINGVACKSSVRAINPSTGGYIWEHCNPMNAVVASVTEVPGLIIAEEGNIIDVMNATNGNEIKQLIPPGANSVFDAPASVSQGMLFVGNLNGNLYEFGV